MHFDRLMRLYQYWQLQALQPQSKLLKPQPILIQLQPILIQLQTILMQPLPIKYCARELAQPFTELFNLCTKNGCMPDEWKIAIVTPVYKASRKIIDQFL